MKIDIAGLQVDAVTKNNFLNIVQKRTQVGNKSFVTTVYSEFLHAALQDRDVLNMLNKADICVADGIGVMWAAKFLSLPFTVRSYYGKIIQAFWQTIYSGAAILFRPQWIRSIIPEKIVGADLIWDLTALAAKNNWTIFLVGGFGNTPALVAQKLESFARDTLSDGRQETHQKLIAGYSAKDPHDPSLVEDIKKANPDMVFVAYGPIKQEQWIVENMEKLPAKFYIGLGGTFDYIAGERKAPPHFIRSIGLEWLYRLLTQPYRYKRIFNGVVGLIIGLVRYKVLMSCPLRKNAVAIIFNKENKILICNRTFSNSIVRAYGPYKDFWQFPQGGIDENEQATNAALRESQEETGITSLDVLGLSLQKHEYTWINANRQLLKISNRNPGQLQSLVYLRYQGTDEELKLDQKVFKDYLWVTIEELEHLVHPFRIPLINIITNDIKSGLVKLG